MFLISTKKSNRSLARFLPNWAKGFQTRHTEQYIPCDPPIDKLKVMFAYTNCTSEEFKSPEKCKRLLHIEYMANILGFTYCKVIPVASGGRHWRASTEALKMINIASNFGDGISIYFYVDDLTRFGKYTEENGPACLSRLGHLRDLNELYSEYARELDFIRDGGPMSQAISQLE